MFLRPALIALLFAPALPAAAAELSGADDGGMGCTLHLSGTLAMADATALQEIIDAPDAQQARLCLNSHEGAFTDALALAHVVAKAGHWHCHPPGRTL